MRPARRRPRSASAAASGTNTTVPLLRGPRTTRSSRTTVPASASGTRTVGNSAVEQPHHRLHHQRREPPRRRRAVPVRRHSRRHGVASRLSAPTLHAQRRVRTTRSSCGTLPKCASRPAALGGGAEKDHFEIVFSPAKQQRLLYNTLAASTPTPTAILAIPTARSHRCTLTASRCGTATSPATTNHSSARRVVTGRYVQAVAAGVEPDGDRRVSGRLPGLRGHRRSTMGLSTTLTLRAGIGRPVQCDERPAPGSRRRCGRPLRLQLGRDPQSAHAGPRRHGHLAGQAGLRLDFEPDRQHGMLTGPSRSPQPHDPAVQSRIRAYKPATVTGRRPRRRLTVTDPTSSFRRRGAPTSASIGCWGGGWSGPAEYSTTATSTASTTSTPTCRPHRHRSRVPTIARGGPVRRAAARPWDRALPVSTTVPATRSPTPSSSRTRTRVARGTSRRAC